MSPIHALLGGMELQVHYQPIVDIASGQVVAYEALARGPQGSSLEAHEALFAAARNADLYGELDWACAERALIGALEAELSSSVSLLINVEAATLGTWPPEAFLERAAQAKARDLRVVIEITERAVANRPAELLSLVSLVRTLGWGLAMDDVGVDPGSLALLPFVRPDIVKLDMDLVRTGRGSHVASTATAVMAYAEQTGASILGEGIETSHHLRRAVSMGATLAQGWMFGRPGPLPNTARSDAPPISLLKVDDARSASPWEDHTPFSIVVRDKPSRLGTKDVLLDISNYLEAEALAMQERPVLVGAFQTADRFTPSTRRRYQRLARHCTLVGALGVGLDARTVPKVRGASLELDDPLIDEWSVVVVGPHRAIALVAKDLRQPGLADHNRLFEFTVTHDRELVVSAAKTLLARVIGL